MTYLRFWPKSIPSTSTIHQRTGKFAVFATILLATLSACAQEPQTSPQQTPIDQSQTAGTTVTLPAGTRLALVLTHPVQSRVLHRGDDIYAQITSPVNSGSEMVIPPGTFVQGIIAKLDNKDGRGEVHLQSMSITFPDGYVAPVSGPITLESSPGYAIKDPGGRRAVAAFALPAAGAGLGALIGHSVGKAQTETTMPFPPGCIGAPPFCTSTTTPVFGTKGKGRDHRRRDWQRGRGDRLPYSAFQFASLLPRRWISRRNDLATADHLEAKRSGCRSSALDPTSGS